MKGMFTALAVLFVVGCGSPSPAAAPPAQAAPTAAPPAPAPTATLVPAPAGGGATVIKVGPVAGTGASGVLPSAISVAVFC